MKKFFSANYLRSVLNWLKPADDLSASFIRRANIFFTPQRIFLTTLILLLFHCIFALVLNSQLYRDVAGVYAWYASEFGRGIWWDEPISKVPPLNIFMGGLLVRCGVEAYTSVIILAITFMWLTLLPLYKFLRLFVTPRSAAWGCMLFIFAPKLLRFSGTGLLESTRDFFLVSAFYLLFKSWNCRCRWQHWVLFGITLGFLSISRGEGILFAGGLGIGLLIHPLAQWKSPEFVFKNIFRPVIITIIAALAIMSPVLIQNFKVTGYPVTDARQIPGVQLIPGADKCFTLKETQRTSDSRILQYPPAETSGTSIWAGHLERLQNFLPNLIRGAYEPYLILAIAGMIMMLRNRKWRKEFTFIVIYSILLSCSYILSSVAHRYFIFMVPLFMVFTLYALSKLLESAARLNVRNILLTIFGAVLFLQPLNAWLWMLKSDPDEQKVKKFISQQRQLMLPENSPRKLIIHGDSRIIFRCGEDRLFHYGEYMPGVKYITGFDLLFVSKKSKSDIAACLARKDLRQVEAPFRKYAVFAPMEGRKK